MTAARQTPLSRLRLWGSIDSTALKLLAAALMLCDHLWATVIPGNDWMTCLGRLAFPIFAFQISEGYFHTSDKRKYRRRLLIAALVSEIPFNLMLTGAPFFIFHQNTIFTLLLGLLAIDTAEQMRREGTGLSIGHGLIRLGGLGLLSIIGFPDYGLRGVLTVLLFYVCRDFPLAMLGQLLGMIVLHVVTAEGRMIPLALGSLRAEFPLQGFAVLALIPIWLYNGKKGPGGKAVQYGIYFFYPVHMLILYLIGNSLP